MVQDVYPAVLMTRTSSHVDDIIEEVVEPTPSPPSSSYTTPPQLHTRSTKPSIEQQQMEEAEEAVGETRSASLTTLNSPRILSPRSVLAFLIVTNGGECETADESNWENDVEEIEDSDDDDDDMGGLSMHDILASLPQTTTSYISPFPSIVTSYPSAPSLLPSASALRPLSRHPATSLSYPSLTVLARHTRREQHLQQTVEREEAKLNDEEDECESGASSHWYDDSRVASTRSIPAA